MPRRRSGTSGDPRAVDRGGSAPLQYAISGRHRAAIDLLLERGVDPNVRNTSGDTPLRAVFGDAQIEALLRRGGARR
jgi:ankyrin repeat protein